MKLIMIDLDGTLFDTKEVNYLAYKEAIEPFGFSIDYDYYCKFCNGRHYLDFLPQITTQDESILSEIHNKKKEVYPKYLSKAKINIALVEILKACKDKTKIALVTTASKENTYQILDNFYISELFDLILTHDDVTESKPDPEGYIKAMAYFGAENSDCVIFEDSGVGVEAAEKSGANVFVVKGFN